MSRVKYYILAINAKTLGLSNYKAGNKVWIVTLDPKFGLPFVEGTITDDKRQASNLYTVQLTLKDRLSSKTTPQGLQRLLGEMLILDGLTREDERVVTRSTRHGY
jgi:hypothetical protein